jgi:adenosylcobinamide kinase/adenosylcobinamide-phosphate guanylyltransferase
MRGPEWQTIEEPIEIVDRIGQFGEEKAVILLDCITLWISNLLLKWEDDRRVLEEVDRLIESIEKSAASFILVSNEVGMGIVPADPISRRFRDLTGWANQRVAEAADTVIFMASGIPLILKGKP